MMNGLSFDVEDWFQVENLKTACPFHAWDSYESRVERNTRILLDLLDEKRYKATFFVLGWIAERFPGLIKEIAGRGHEIASHGYDHQIVYNMSLDQFAQDIKRSKCLLEDISQQPVVGYRAPNFSITKKSRWALDILFESGFKYDSSVFPTSFHDRYGFSGINNSDAFRFENSLVEFPITVYKLGNVKLPLGGGAYFRIVPYPFFRFFLKQVNDKNKPFVFYLHPWEIDRSQPRMKISFSSYLRHYTNLCHTEKKLHRLFDDFRFTTLNSFITDNYI
ncbi:MAG TPA: DUF3473 domain-containing protein [Candidatus Omnitrophota bacterium]|nr:DUF3473 domain-containing protein [Candidatus Omnitrophota bacterium]